MKIRFQVVSSLYHKGRLRIQFDPEEFGNKEFNVNYTHIVDIADDKDFTLEYGWASERHFLKTGDVSAATDSFTIGANHPVDLERYNGQIRVLVLNELTVPNTDINNDVQVNVFVSFEDLELAQPDSTNISELSYHIPVTEQSGFEPQAGYEPQAGLQSDMEMTTQPSAPEQTVSKDTTAKEIDTSDPTFHVFFGEVITSLTQMLKRYNYVESYVLNDSAANVENYMSKVSSSIPPFYGFSATGVHQTLAGNDFNYTNNTYLNWVMPAFTCWRGSIRRKILYDHANAAGANTSMYAHLLPEDVDYAIARTELTPNASNSTYNDFYRSLYDNSFNGAAITPTNEQPFLEIEIPFYTNRRFFNARSIDNERSNTPSTYYRVVAYSEAPFDGHRPVINEFIAAGEDFSLSYFVGIPVVYEQTPPAPSTTA
jgi:hypothetical protein